MFEAQNTAALPKIEAAAKQLVVWLSRQKDKEIHLQIKVFDRTVLELDLKKRRR